MGCCNFSNANGMELEELEENEFDNFNGNGMLDFEGEVEDGDELDDEFEGEDDEEFDEFGKRARARRKRKKELKALGLSRKEARKQAKAEIGKKGVWKASYSRTPIGSPTRLKPKLNVEQRKALSSPPPLAGGGTSAPTTGMDALGVGEAGKPKQTFAGVIQKNWWIGAIVVVVVGGYFAFGKKLGIRK